MIRDNEYKISSLYLNEETHKAISKWSELTGLSIAKICKNTLEDMTPVFNEMIKAYEDIQSGKDAQKVLQNMLASGLQLASDRLREDE